MSSLFTSTRNTRALPTGDYRYIRSDIPAKLTDKEILWLKEHDVTTIVDFREEKEVNKVPCPLAKLDGFHYINLPVTGGGDTSKSIAHLKQVYLQMVDEQMDLIIPHRENLETILERFECIQFDT